MPSTTEKGKKFEHEVAELYRSLGYHVDHNITSPGGKQTDLVATRTVPGAPTIKLYIECKAYDVSRLSTDHVRKFQYDYHSVSKDGKYTGGILVTKNTPSREACDAITDPQCRLLSLAQLFDESLNASSQLRSFVTRYQEQEIFSSYIPLKCSHQSRSANVFDLEQTAVKWIKGDSEPDDPSLFVILGDFGTGKTTFLNHLKKTFADEYLSGSSAQIPVLLALRNYGETNDIEKFIETQIQNELDIRISYHQFTRFLKTGRILLFLDGFDEMSQKVDKTTRILNFEKLLSFIIESQKSVLTCRPAYFVSDSEIRTTFGHLASFREPACPPHLKKSQLKRYQNFFVATTDAFSDATFSNQFSLPKIVYILPFTERDIDQYVSTYEDRYLPSHVPDVLRERIRTTYDLEDLSRRPVLLHLIVKTLPTIPDDLEASPSIVYEKYTETWMVRDFSKGHVRRLITAERKRSFMESLAWNLLSANKFTVTHAELLLLVESFFTSDESMAQFLTTDIQACSFLQRDFGHQFRFAHRSFLEYFVAAKIRKSLLIRDPSLLNKALFSDEVAFFVGDMLQHFKLLKIVLDELFQKSFPGNQVTSQEEVNLQHNLLKILASARCKLPPFPLRFVNVLKVTFIQNTFVADIRHCTFQNVTMKKCRLDTVHIQDCRASDYTIADSKLRSTRIRDLRRYREGGKLRILRSTINDIFLEGEVSCDFEKAKVNGLQMECDEGDVVFRRCTIMHASFSQEKFKLSLYDNKIRFATFTGLSKVHSELAVTVSQDTHFWERLGAATQNWDWRNVEFRDCLFFWIDFSAVNLEDVDFDSCIFVCCRFNTGVRSAKGIITEHLSFNAKKLRKCRYFLSTLTLEAYSVRMTNYQSAHSNWKQELNRASGIVIKIKQKISDTESNVELNDKVFQNKLGILAQRLKTLRKLRKEIAIRINGTKSTQCMIHDSSCSASKSVQENTLNEPKTRERKISESILALEKEQKAENQRFLTSKDDYLASIKSANASLKKAEGVYQQILDIEPARPDKPLCSSEALISAVRNSARIVGRDPHVVLRTDSSMLADSVGDSLLWEHKDGVIVPEWCLQPIVVEDFLST